MQYRYLTVDIIDRQLLDKQIEWLSSCSKCDEREGVLNLLSSISYSIGEFDEYHAIALESTHNVSKG